MWEQCISFSHNYTTLTKIFLLTQWPSVSEKRGSHVQGYCQRQEGHAHKRRAVYDIEDYENYDEKHQRSRREKRVIDTADRAQKEKKKTSGKENESQKFK